MKKLIQLALVLILIAGLFLFVAPEPTAGSMGSIAAVSTDFGSTTVVEENQMASCLTLRQRMICVVPNVGWNT